MKQPKKIGKSGGKKTGKGHKIGSLKASAAGRGVMSAKAREWMAEAGRFFKPLKKPVTLRLDADVIAWFKARGRGYQTRINRALREVMMAERKRR